MRLAFICAALAFSILPLAGHAQVQAGTGYHFDARDLQKFQMLSPAERAAAISQAQEQLKSMNPTDKQAIVDQARTEFGGLSPADQEQLKTEALQRWQAMSPQEQQELRNAFPGMLQGELQPQ